MSLLPKKFDILILYICTINGCQNYLVCSKRIETLISECLCIFIGRIQVIFIGLWPGTQSRIGTFVKGTPKDKYDDFFVGGYLSPEFLTDTRKPQMCNRDRDSKSVSMALIA